MNKSSNRIRERREQLGISREVLSGLVEVSATQIYRYESGENDPTGKVLIKLADALTTTTDWLLGRDADGLDEVEREAIQVLRSTQPNKRGNIVEIMRLATR